MPDDPLNIPYDQEQFLGYLENELPSDERARFEQQLLGDARLRNLVAQLILDRQHMRLLPDETPPPQIMDSVREQLERKMLLDAPDTDADAVSTGRSIWIGPLLTYSGLAALVLIAVGIIINTFNDTPQVQRHSDIAGTPMITDRGDTLADMRTGRPAGDEPSLDGPPPAAAAMRNERSRLRDLPPVPEADAVAVAVAPDDGATPAIEMAMATNESGESDESQPRPLPGVRRVALGRNDQYVAITDPDSQFVRSIMPDEVTDHPAFEGTEFSRTDEAAMASAGAVDDSDEVGTPRAPEGTDRPDPVPTPIRTVADTGRSADGSGLTRSASTQPQDDAIEIADAESPMLLQVAAQDVVQGATDATTWAQHNDIRLAIPQTTRTEVIGDEKIDPPPASVDEHMPPIEFVAELRRTQLKRLKAHLNERQGQHAVLIQRTVTGRGASGKAKRTRDELDRGPGADIGMIKTLNGRPMGLTMPWASAGDEGLKVWNLSETDWGQLLMPQLPIESDPVVRRRTYDGPVQVRIVIYQLLPSNTVIHKKVIPKRDPDATEQTGDGSDESAPE